MPDKWTNYSRPSSTQYIEGGYWGATEGSGIPRSETERYSAARNERALGRWGQALLVSWFNYGDFATIIPNSVQYLFILALRIYCH